MIWHIFKKDWTLLYPFAAAVAAVHLGLMAALLQVGRFNGLGVSRIFFLAAGPNQMYALTNVLPQVALLASAFLIVAIVQQDAIPGVTQDWLVRPIKRRDLLLAKLVSVLIMVQAPIFAVDLIGALLNGFPLGQSLSAAAGHFVYLWFIPILPIFAFAALTRNFMEAIVGGTVIVAVRTVLTMPIGIGRLVPLSYMNPMTGFGWINLTIHLAILLAGAALLLSLLYFHRKTILSRSLLAVLILVYEFVPQVPLHAAFALEQRLSPEPGAGNSIAINFVPDRAALEDRQTGPGAYGRGEVFVLLPIRVTGIPDGSVLNGDFSSVHLILPGGESTSLGNQMGFQVWKEDPGDAEKAFSYGFRMPGALYRRLADQPLRVEVNYSLTLLRLAQSAALPATGGDLRTQGLGWCGTQMDSANNEISFGCIQAGPPPTCASFVLEYTPTHARNPKDAVCHPDYSPFRDRYEPDALSRFTERLPFGDPNGIDLYPVKAPMLADSLIKVRAYLPQDHFTRQLVIPTIRLRDWAAE